MSEHVQNEHQSPVDGPPALPAPSSRGKKRVIFGLLLLVSLPVVFHACRGEVDRWRAARVIESWLDGEKETAIAELGEISKRLPDDHQIKFVLAEWMLGMGATDRNYQKADEALALIMEVPEQFQNRRWEILQQHCLLAMGKQDEALKAYEDANPANESRSIELEIYHKNSLAYFQALADVELDVALTNSNFVVIEVSNFWNSQNKHIPLSAHMQGLFCSALIYHHQMTRFESDADRVAELADKASTVLSGAIGHLENEYSRLCQPPTVSAADEEQAGDLEGSDGEAAEKPKDEPGESEPGESESTEADSKEAESEQTDSSDTTPNAAKTVKTGDESKTGNRKEDAAHALATLLTLRALVYQDVAQYESSFADRRRVKQLGFDPEKIAEAMPSLSSCVFQLELVAMVLDTRGCVNYRLNNLPAAKADLNIAVIAQQTLVDVAEFTPRTRRDSSLDPRQQFEDFVRGPQRTLAALIFHRSWARLEANDMSGYASDVRGIRNLGFIPGNYLF